jgi:hypothetical protein
MLITSFFRQAIRIEMEIRNRSISAGPISFPDGRTFLEIGFPKSRDTSLRDGAKYGVEVFMGA